MGLMSTLTKVALGYAAARGMDHLSRGGGINGLLGGGARVAARDPMAQGQARMIDSLSGKGTPMSGMLDQLSSRGFDLSALTGGASNPLAQMMQQAQNQAQAMNPAAMMGGAAAGMAGLAAAGASATGQGLGAMIDQFNLGDTAPQAEETAGLMLRAMIQAAKCDGDIDANEKTRILESLGDTPDASDAAFLREQLAAPVDPAALAQDTPPHLRVQVYTAALMTVRVDTQAEADFLDTLARGMELTETAVNAVHLQMGMQPLYG